MKKILKAMAAAAICTTACTGVQTSLDGMFSEMFPEREPGGAVLIMQGDKVVYDKGFGTADLATMARIDGETSFNIASCSKQFTAVAVLQLAQEGCLSVEDRIIDHFPEFLRGEPSDSIWNDIRIKHLLSHSSGIPDARGYLSHEQKVFGDETLALEYLNTLDHLNFTPGTQYEYINPTFVLLGRLVERITGTEFTTYVQEHIFTPAGMDRTVFFDPQHQDLIPDMARGYEYDDVSSMGEERAAAGPESPSVKEWYEYDYGEESFFATRPDGGIYSSTHEIARWEKALREGRILSKEMLAEAWTPVTLVSGSDWSDYQNRPGTWYGYGWFIEQEEGETSPSCIYHTGDNGGFKALVARYPKTDALLVILANRADWDRQAARESIEKILNLK